MQYSFQILNSQQQPPSLQKQQSADDMELNSTMLNELHSELKRFPSMAKIKRRDLMKALQERLQRSQPDLIKESVTEAVKGSRPLFYQFFDTLYKRSREVGYLMEEKQARKDDEKLNRLGLSIKEESEQFQKTGSEVSTPSQQKYVLARTQSLTSSIKKREAFISPKHHQTLKGMAKKTSTASIQLISNRSQSPLKTQQSLRRNQAQISKSPLPAYAQPQYLNLSPIKILQNLTTVKNQQSKAFMYSSDLIQEQNSSLDESSNKQRIGLKRDKSEEIPLFLTNPLIQNKNRDLLRRGMKQERSVSNSNGIKNLIDAESPQKKSLLRSLRKFQGKDAQNVDEKDQEYQDEAFSHSLERESLLEFELKRVKDSYSSIFYIQNLLKCFYSEDIFQMIVSALADDVICKLTSKTSEQSQLQEIYDLTLEGQKKQQSSLQKMIAEKRAREAIDPELLQLKVQQLQQKLEKQTKDYYLELDVYRSQLRKSQNSGINGKELLELKKEVLEVRLFDECDLIPQEHRRLMNQKITDLQNLYAKQVYMQLQAQKVLLIKLNAFEKLKPQQYCLIDLDLDEIVSALPALEADPHQLWAVMERHYRANFFDGVILKKYGQLFEDKNEGEFVDHLRIVRDEVKQESQLLAMHYEGVVKQIKSQYNEKVLEAREHKEQYLHAYEKAYREAQDQAQQQYEEREQLIFSRWEQERAGLMDEMAEVEKQYAHFDVQLAQEKFRSFVFRWCTLNKVAKMKKFDRDSYEFLKANLEVQEALKVDIDGRVEVAIQKEKEKTSRAKSMYYQTLEEMCNMKFENMNMKRLLAQKDRLVEEMKGREQVLGSNLRYAKDRNRELQEKATVLSNDNRNARELGKALEDKYASLSQRIDKMKDLQNMSVLDLKQVFGVTERTVYKNRLVDEVMEVVKKLHKKMKRLAAECPMHNRAIELKHQGCGTELRNVNRDICYLQEHGQGILCHQETQMERVVAFGKECQTEESLMKAVVKHIQIEQVDRNSSDRQQNNKQRTNHPLQPGNPIDLIKKQTKTQKDSAMNSFRSSMQSNNRKNEAKASHQPYQQAKFQTRNNKLQASGSLASSSQNADKSQNFSLNLGEALINNDVTPSSVSSSHVKIQNEHHPRRQSRSFRRGSAEADSHDFQHASHIRNASQSQGMNTINKDAGKEEAKEAHKSKRRNKGAHIQFEDSHAQDQGEDATNRHRQKSKTNTKTIQSLDQDSFHLGNQDADHDIQGRSLSDISLPAQDHQRGLHNQSFTLGKGSANSRLLQRRPSGNIQGLKEKYAADKLPQVFNRLWKHNQAREEKMKVYRDQSRDRDNLQWTQKLAGNNSLQKTYEGMQVYQDPNSGKCFVHIEDLRQRVMQSTNSKDPAQFLNQQNPSEYDHSGRNQNSIGQQLLHANHSQSRNIGSVYLTEQNTEATLNHNAIESGLAKNGKLFKTSRVLSSHKSRQPEGLQGVSSKPNMFLNNNSSFENSPERPTTQQNRDLSLDKAAAQGRSLSPHENQNASALDLSIADLSQNQQQQQTQLQATFTTNISRAQSDMRFSNSFSKGKKRPSTGMHHTHALRNQAQKLQSKDSSSNRNTYQTNLPLQNMTNYSSTHSQNLAAPDRVKSQIGFATASSSAATGLSQIQVKGMMSSGTHSGAALATNSKLQMQHMVQNSSKIQTQLQQQYQLKQFGLMGQQLKANQAYSLSGMRKDPLEQADKRQPSPVLNPPSQIKNPVQAEVSNKLENSRSQYSNNRRVVVESKVANLRNDRSVGAIANPNQIQIQHFEPYPSAVFTGHPKRDQKNSSGMGTQINLAKAQYLRNNIQVSKD